MRWLLLLPVPVLVWALIPRPPDGPVISWEDAEAGRLVHDLERGREGALEEILRRRLPKTVPALLVLLSEKDLEGVHRGICPTLHLGNPFHEDPLENALCCSDASWVYFSTELKQRGCVRTGYAGERAFEELAAGTDPVLRSVAFIRLWQGGSARNVPAILSALSETAVRPYPWLWSVAGSIRRETLGEALREGIGRSEVRSLAAAAALRHRPSVEPLLDALAEAIRPGASESWRADMAWTLGEIRDARAVPALLKEVRDGTYWSQADAAEALGKIGDRSVVPALVDCVPSARALTQASIFRTIGRLGGRTEIPLLERYAANPEYTGAIGRRSSAALALEEIQSRER